MPAWPADSVPYRAPTEGEQRNVGLKTEVTNRETQSKGILLP